MTSTPRTRTPKSTGDEAPAESRTATTPPTPAVTSTGGPGAGGAGDPSSHPLILLDGMSLAFRAYFALPPDLATSAGVVTNAVHGFTSMVVNLVRDHRPVGPGRGLRPARWHLPRRHRRGLQGRAGRDAARPPAPVRHDPRGPRRRWPSRWSRRRGVRGRRRAGHAGHRGPGPGTPGDHRHRRPRQLPARRGPLRPGALQPAGRERLRPLRRGGHLGAHRGAPGEVPTAGRAARRPLRQPARRARAWGRRPRPSWSTSTATSTASSPTSTS